jgi:hypothetical protein
VPVKRDNISAVIVSKVPIIIRVGNGGISSPTILVQNIDTKFEARACLYESKREHFKPRPGL